VNATDSLPKFVHSYPAAFIINTHPKNKPGEHWIAVYFYANLKAVYFDSYGFPPRNKYVVKFLKMELHYMDFFKKSATSCSTTSIFFGL
jgi:hypothetical protein